ncbi:MAG: hypothetical protein ACI4U3_09780 [Traorella sp.]
MKDLTEIVFILDRSGSMSGLEKDTIGGFNSMIQKQQKEKGQALVSTILFDNVSEVLHNRIPIDKVNLISEKDYYVRGCTALLDAVGGAIYHISNTHKYLGEFERPEKTLFVITTDGMENASRKYSYEQVKAMIEEKQKEFGWEFIFLGANIDAIGVASRFGIHEDHAVNYHNDAIGTAINYQAINEAITQVRTKQKGLTRDWKKSVEKDYRNRK